MGRPIKLGYCSKCGEARPSSLIRLASGKHGKPGVCFVCAPRGRFTSEEWRARADAMMRTCSNSASVPHVPHGTRQLRLHSAGGLLALRVEEHERVNALSDFFRKWSTVPRCSCCRIIGEPENPISPDSDGNYWCRECSISVFTCGRCTLHPGPVFFPVLVGNPEPPSPLSPPPEPTEIVVDMADEDAV